ncbi:MAG: hypothetical protein WA880_12920, partial [Ornithinimicrobium sp.]
MSGSALRNAARARIGSVPDLVGTIPQLQSAKRANNSSRRAPGPKIPRLPGGDIREDGFDWLAPPVADRSWQFHLHSWDYFMPWLASYVNENDDAALKFCLDGALEWWRQVDAAPQGTEGMAWYDMSVGSRAPILALLILIA